MDDVIDFGMFTLEGNLVISNLVDFANNNNLEWNIVRNMLDVLSKDERFSECMDTAVREVVYESVNSVNHPFYL
jgi:acetone carboxylase gamma subunit